MNELKPIKLTDEETGRTWTLHFTRNSIKKMEQSGFNINDLEAHPMVRIPELFYGAFLADQPFMKRKDTDDILFNKLGGMSDAMLERLGELYAEPFNTLISTEGATENPCKMAVEM